MVNWIGIEEASKKYKVSEKRMLQWCEQNEIVSSEIGGYWMIDEDSLKKRLELNKRESISKVELEARTMEILQKNHERIFILESLVKLTPIMQIVLKELGEMISKDDCKELFLYLSSGGKTEDYAKEHGLTIIKVQNILDSAILEIQRNIKYLKQYPKKRLLLKSGTKKHNCLKNKPKSFKKPMDIVAGEVPAKVADLLSTPVEDLGLDAWTLHSLTTNQITTLGDLLFYTKSNGFCRLLELNRFGSGCLAKLKNRLLYMDIINANDECYLYDYMA